VDAEHTFAGTAAELRAEGEELQSALESLAGRFADALPEHTEVVRSGGGLLGRGERHVERVTIQVGGAKYALAMRDGQLTATCQREVGGVSAARVELVPEEWLDELEADLRAEAARNVEARRALERLRS
jgi:hypothetical protein